jgi:eukaryotic-like serine/threonine-protein kinase
VDPDDTIQSAAVRIEDDRLAALPEKRRLGEYDLVAELARGGLAIVYLGLRRGELVVVKELRHEFLGNSGLVTMFDKEARLAARLNHPNIVQTIEIGTAGGCRFMAMEYLEGHSLYEVVYRAVSQSKRMQLPMQLRVLLEVLSGLEGAHEASDGDRPLSVVHGDVSPHNVLLTYGGQVKLVDFGIADTFGAIVGGCRSGARDAMVRYMAPEQAAGESMDRRADLFAVGVMLWEAIVDRGPWEDQPDATVWGHLRSGAVPRVRDAWPYIDASLGAIVDRSMSVQPELRYRTALEMRRELERHIATRHIRVPDARSLGDFVSRLFVEERDLRRTQLERRIRSAMAAEPPRRTGPASIPPLALPIPSPPLRRRLTTWPVAIAACLGACLAVAAVSATRPRTPHKELTTAPGLVSIGTVSRPYIPVVSIDEIPRAPSVAALPSPPSATSRPGPKPTTLAAHATSPAAPTSDCAPPYIVNPQTGKKQWRLECL